MKSILFFLIIITTFNSSLWAAKYWPSKFRNYEEATEPSITDDIPIEAHTFSQNLDHWNPFNRKKFQQNYWTSVGYANQSHSPVLFYICGETACSASDVAFMFPWAKLIGASVVVIEHRYYGTSQPFAKNTTENLRWLNMPQALADFAKITEYLKNEKGLRGPWVVAGASYSGMLAASFRLSYPHLVKGAWASSAPVHVIEDDTSYDQKMTEDVGPSCANSLRQVTAAAEKAIQNPESFATLRQLFGAEALTDPDDFLFGIIDVAAAAVQYRRTSLLCDSFKTEDVIQDYAAFLKSMVETLGYTPDAYSFANGKDTTAGGPFSDLRSFYYQQCSEFGLFQTAAKDPLTSVRSQRLDMNYMKKGCARIFGRTFQSGVNYVNHRYYDPLLTQNVSEIYFTNGSLDPWMPLGIATENGNWHNPGLYALMLAGSSHADDISFRRKDRSPDLQKAAGIIELLLKKWTR